MPGSVKGMGVTGRGILGRGRSLCKGTVVTFRSTGLEVEATVIEWEYGLER